MADCDLDSHDHRASDADFLRRRWLPVDCDPVRPAGISADSALVAGVLAGLAACFDDERVKIDQKVGNAVRIWKL